MSKAMSLKARIRNIARQKNIPAQVILQNYMFERLLVRLSVSDYKEKFVLKGGMLVAAIVGLDNRATMDMDTTLKNLPLTPEAIRSALEDICDIAFDDTQSLQFAVAEFADPGDAHHIRKKSLLVIVAKRGDRQVKHFRYFSDRIHNKNLLNSDISIKS